jgi:outer membrane protein assembly factor BamB
LIGPTVARPVLYAVDAMTMQLLWSSTAAELDVGGKYVHPTIARGTVFVGTDRIQAFGLHP